MKALKEESGEEASIAYFTNDPRVILFIKSMSKGGKNANTNNNAAPATSKAPRGGARKDMRVDPEAMAELVRQLEGQMHEAAAQISKKGMTKAQAKQLEDKLRTVEISKQQMEHARQRFPPDAELHRAFQAQKEAQMKAWAESQYVNQEMPLKAVYSEWNQVAPSRWVRFEQFDKSNERMSDIVELYDQELSEPYSSFTYQFFIFGWPDLCVLAYGVEAEAKPEESTKGTFIGAVVSRVSRKGPGHPLRGYVAMLAVKPSFRGARIGSRLVEASVDLMVKKGCDEVSLETPVSNARALKLYLDLGFAKVKFLPAYYLDGADAFRLKLYLHDVGRRVAQVPAEAAAEEE